MALEQEREAVALLAEMLLDAAAKGRGRASGGVLDGAFGGAVSLPDEGGKVREAA